MKALDRTEAHLCVLAASCNEPAYTKLITALCKEHSIPKVPCVGVWGVCWCVASKQVLASDLILPLFR